MFYDRRQPSVDGVERDQTGNPACVPPFLCSTFTSTSVPAPTAVMRAGRSWLLLGLEPEKPRTWTIRPTFRLNAGM